MKFTTLLYIAILALAVTATTPAVSAQGVAGNVRWHNEAADTTRITQMLTEVSAQGTNQSPNELMVKFARMLIGTPYEGGTLEIEPEMLTVNLDGMDCTTFVETVAALAMTVAEGRNSWQDFAFNLEQLRYRQGHVNGYPSRLHYVSDWVVDNTHRGNLAEMTDRLPGSAYQVKTLDYMSRHRDSYPAMKDDAVFAKIKDCEVGYRSHRYPFMRNSALMGKKAGTLLKEGDIIAFTTKTEGLDVSHMGIIVIDNGEPHVIHASSKASKVIEDPLTLGEYLKKNHTLTGARFFRIGAQR